MEDVKSVIEGLDEISGYDCRQMSLFDNDVFIRKTAQEAADLLKSQQAEIERLQVENELIKRNGEGLDEQRTEFANKINDLIWENKQLKEGQPVRCKDCIHRENKNRCILAFVADKQGFPLPFYDSRGEWFCADGKRKDGEQT